MERSPKGTRVKPRSQKGKTPKRQQQQAQQDGQEMGDVLGPRPRKWPRFVGCAITICLLAAIVSWMSSSSSSGPGGGGTVATGAAALMDSLPALPATPLFAPWPLYTVGQGLLAILYNTYLRLLPPQKALLYHTTAYFRTSALTAAAEVGVADCLPEHEQVSIEYLAQCTASSPSHLERLLRALSSINVFEETRAGEWRHTHTSRLLREDHPDSMKGTVLMFGHEQFVAMSKLSHAIKTKTGSKVPFEVYYKQPFWDYHNEHPVTQSEFDSGLQGVSAGSVRALATDYPGYSKFRSLVDVAGGTGIFLTRLLGANPTLKGVLFDQPSVIVEAANRLVTTFDDGELPSELSSELGERLELKTGSFFNAGSIPKGHDAYMLKFILHDWNDVDCVRILKGVRSAMSHNATLLIAERILKPRAGLVDGEAGYFVDLLMMSNFQAKERYAEDFERILTSAGFRLNHIFPTRSEASMIEAVPMFKGDVEKPGPSLPLTTTTEDPVPTLRRGASTGSTPGSATGEATRTDVNHHTEGPSLKAAVDRHAEVKARAEAIHEILEL